MHDIHLLLAGTFVCNFYFLSSLAPDGCSTAAVVGSASECRELRGGGKELRDTALSSSCWAFPFSPLLRWAALLLPSARDNQRWKLLDKVQKREKTITRREREKKNSRPISWQIHSSFMLWQLLYFHIGQWTDFHQQTRRREKWLEKQSLVWISQEGNFP